MTPIQRAAPRRTLEIPADLIALKRHFTALLDRQAQLAAALPSSPAIANGQAALTTEQQDAWTRIQAELTETALQIHQHPHLAALQPLDRYKADRAATKAATDPDDA